MEPKDATFTLGAAQADLHAGHPARIPGASRESISSEEVRPVTHLGRRLSDFKQIPPESEGIRMLNLISDTADQVMNALGMSQQGGAELMVDGGTVDAALNGQQSQVDDLDTVPVWQHKIPDPEQFRQKRDSLEDDIKRLERVFKRINEHYDTLTDETEQWIRQTQAQSEGIDRLSSVIVRLNNQRCKDLDDLNKWKGVAETHAQSTEKLRRHIRQLDDQIQEKDTCIKGLVEKVQRAGIHQLSGAASASLPDDQIRNQLHELFEEIARWSRGNARSSDECAMDDHLWNMLAANRLVVEELGGLPELKFESQTCIDTFLNAALSKRVCETFLSSPFFMCEETHLSAENQESREDRLLATQDLLKSRYEQALGGTNVALAHSWRSQTVQLLSNEAGFKGTISALCAKAIDGFLTQWATLITADVSEEAHADLADIFTSFARFAVELWSQKYSFTWHMLPNLQDEMFSVKSAQMEAARAMKLDDKDTSLDGRPIVMVLQPLIEGSGTTDGRQYDQVRVWSKAVVWVAAEDPP